MFAPYLQEWCGCQSFGCHLSRGPGGLGSVPALSARLWSLRLLWKDSKFLPLLCSCAFERRLLPMVSQLNYVGNMSACSLAPPWFCPRSSWTQVPGLMWTCRWASMRRLNRLTMATITSSHSYLLCSSYLGTAQSEPPPVLPSRLSISLLVSAKTRQWTDLQHSNWSPDWLNPYPA